MWHRDQEDRIIEPVESTDWKFQLDNELPTLIDKPIFIPRYTWHRAIKGTGSLKVKITKL
jgi:predicted ATP-grasp superfamily ATP-dependent carboligase